MRLLDSRGAIVSLFILTLASNVAFAGPAPSTSSLAFFANQPDDYDYGQQLVLPPGFGAGELTLELWIRPDDSFPVGSTSGGPGQRLNWSDADEEPYSSCCWWFAGNFLLDGHNNNDFEQGTFSLQLYGGGRLRWLFGDGANVVAGGSWSVGAFPATTTPSLLDGQWHRVNLVRRWQGASEARLELWIDGDLVATETSPVRTDMGTFWGDWSSFPSGQEGWFLAAEKQAAIGALTQYEDYKGPIDEMRFFDRALTPAELDAGGCTVGAGLVGHYAIEEGTGAETCDRLDPARCIALINTMPGFWSADAAPACDVIFSDGFESGDTSSWSLATL